MLVWLGKVRIIPEAAHMVVVHLEGEIIVTTTLGCGY